MPETKSEPFTVTRVPGLNGEWIDLHRSEGGNVCIDSSDYAEVSITTLMKALRQLER